MVINFFGLGLASKGRCIQTSDKLSHMDKLRASHRIMVMSGKGGVGKTTVAVNLALGLALYGRQVGLLDADITGPNVPKMLRLEEEFLEPQEDGSILPATLPVGPDRGLEVVSMAFLVEKDAPITWRGPMKIEMLKQFVERVSWGELDYLVIDLPPGTSDEPITIAQLVEPDGVIIVTTPYDVALMDAEKAIDMVRAMDLPILGIIENMSGFCCPDCGEKINFKTGGGEKAASRLNIPFLGRIEIDPKICQAGDAGRPFVLDTSTSTARSFEAIVSKIVSYYEGQEEESQG